MDHNDAKQHQSLIEAAQLLQDRQTGIVLSGKIINGKVELDKSTLDQIAKKFAGANKSFVAVNAPFDPKSTAV
jgi:predicted hydrolase (HD superfamily)